MPGETCGLARALLRPERRFDLIRQAAKRDLARRVPRDGTDQAPPLPDHESEFIADFVREELAADVAQ